MKVKIFNNANGKIEKKINDWFEEKGTGISVSYVKQSEIYAELYPAESYLAHTSNKSLTISIFYTEIAVF